MLKRILAPFFLISKHRRLLWQTTWSDVRSKYAGSILGVSWLMLYPLLLLGAYAAVYLYIFKVRFALFNSNEYVVLIFCGLIPFLGFAETLGNGVSSVTTNAGLIKNTLFPIDVIPVKSVLTAQCTQAAGMVLLIISLLILKKLSVWVFLIIPIWLLQILFQIGLVWIVSSLTVFFRELQNIISVIVLILMMISPIAYTADMVPESLRPFLSLNPLYYFITAYQDSLMLAQIPRGNVLIVLSAMSLGFFLFGYWFFSRMKKVFSDNV